MCPKWPLPLNTKPTYTILEKFLERSAVFALVQPDPIGTQVCFVKTINEDAIPTRSSRALMIRKKKWKDR